MPTGPAPDAARETSRGIGGSPCERCPAPHGIGGSSSRFPALRVPRSPWSSGAAPAMGTARFPAWEGAWMSWASTPARAPFGRWCGPGLPRSRAWPSPRRHRQGDMPDGCRSRPGGGGSGHRSRRRTQRRPKRSGGPAAVEHDGRAGAANGRAVLDAGPIAGPPHPVVAHEAERSGRDRRRLCPERDELGHECPHAKRVDQRRGRFASRAGAPMRPRGGCGDPGRRKPRPARGVRFRRPPRGSSSRPDRTERSAGTVGEHACRFRGVGMLNEVQHILRSAEATR